MTDLQKVKIEDDRLSEVIRRSSYSPIDVAMAYRELKSFSKLSAAIGQATRERRPLHQVVGEKCLS